MNKSFKTKYNIKTSQVKAVPEIAKNCQSSTATGGGASLFRTFSLALLMSGLLSSIVYGSDNAYIFDELGNNEGNNYGSTVAPYKCVDNDCWLDRKKVRINKSNESVILSHLLNKTGANTQLTNKDFLHTVAIGSRAVGGGNDATAIGYRAIVGKNISIIDNEDSHQGTAVGYRAFSYGNESVSLGNDTVAYGESSISIGSDNIGSGMKDYSTKGLSYDIWKLFRENGEKFNYTGEYAAIDGADQTTTKEKYQEYLSMYDKKNPYYKTHNWAFGDSSIAIGNRNVAYGHGSLAIGNLSVAKGNYSTALGTGTLAFGDSSVALGNEVYIYSDQSVGVGNNIQALNRGSMVYGLNSYAGGTGSVAIGTRAMSNVKIQGEHNNIIGNGTERVVLDELYDGNSTDNNTKIYNKLSKLDQNKENLYSVVATKQDGTGELKAETNSKTGAVAIGYYVIASGENSLALGRQAYSKGDKSVAIGPYAYSKGEESFALGYGSKSIGNKSFAIGAYSRAEGKDSIALGIGSKVLSNTSNNELNGENSMALGNASEATMKNSVALGYNSNTRYYYTGTEADPKPSNKNNSNNAISLKPYIPSGTSYEYIATSEDGVVSVGGWDKGSGNIGRRRIINVAPGALDSDAATVGQLKALEYAYKEGVVAYYTKEGNKTFKVIKDTDGKFYKVNTENGTPLDNKAIDANKVFAGPKGANEKTRLENGKNIIDMGDKIKFAHILDGEISQNSDEAITGTQLHQLGKTILGLEVNSSDKTKFNTPTFTAVEYNGAPKTGRNNQQKTTPPTTFKKAIDETIIAINKGFIFGDAENNATHQLGDSLIIKAGNMKIKELNKEANFSSNNIRTSYLKNNKELLIGIKDEPTFKRVMLDNNNTPTSDKELVTKAYVDSKLGSGTSNLHYLSVQGSKQDTNSNYNNDGAKAENSVAIGVGAKVEAPTDANNYIDSEKPNAEGGVAIGYNAQSKAKNAIVIGRNVSVDIPNSFVLGSNNIVEQNSKGTKNHLTDKYDAKGERDAVVVIGSGTTLKNSKSSIAIGAVNMEHNSNHIVENNKTKGNHIENAAWATVIGNKNRVYNGTDITALGNNIQVNANKENFSSNTKVNSNLVILGNKAIAANAAGSVVIGAEAKALNGDEKNHVYTAVNNAVAIGKGAIVDKSDSIAIGSSSKTSGNTTNNGYDIATNKASNTSDYIWKPTAGEFAIGDTNNSSKKTRRITGLAAGYDDTDAVNVAQLKKVVGGVATLKYQANGENNQTINLKDKALNFKNGDYTVAKVQDNGVVIFDLNKTAKDKLSNAATNESVTNIQNKLTQIENRKDKTAKVTAESNSSIKVTSSISEEGNTTVTEFKLDLEEKIKQDIKKGVEAGEKLSSKGIKFSGDKGNQTTIKLDEAIKIIGGADKNLSEEKNIAVVVGDKNLTLKLAQNLKGIQSVGLDENYTLAFVKNTDKKVELKVDGEALKFTKANDGVKISNLASADINDTSNEAISAKQLYDLASKLGIDVNDTDKTKFKTLTLSEFKLKEVNGTDGKEPKNVVEGLKNATSKINQGFKFGADNNKSTDPLYLGSRIDIVKLANGSNGSENIKDYNGSNLITNYTKDKDGNAKIEIGFKNSPEFKSVTINEDINSSSNEKLAVNKKYVDSLLKGKASNFKVIA
ncbi:hypothetical protein F1B92_02730, partial [Campylobacter sp. FMV-PI01]